MNIDVIMACGPKSEEYAEFIINNVTSTATTHKFQFILAEHKSDISHLIDNPHVKVIAKMPDDIPVSKHSASISHGRNVNLCVPYVDTDLVMIIDTDFAFVTKGWDRWMVDQFSDPIVGAVGTEYSDKMRGFPKYVNYPTLIMTMMRTELIKKFNIDFKPHGDGVRVSTPEEAIAFGRPIGFTVYPDTGCELALKLRPAGVKGVTVKFHDPAIPCAFPSGQVFLNNGDYFANHMKSGTAQTQISIDAWKKMITDHLRTV